MYRCKPPFYPRVWGACLKNRGVPSLGYPTLGDEKNEFVMNLDSQILSIVSKTRSTMRFTTLHKIE